MKLSIIIPSFNQAKYLPDCLRSVITQDISLADLIVLDAGSTDSSVRVIKEFSSAITWWRSAKDGGQAAAVNEGVKRSQGDIICWLNSDDLLARDSLRTVLTAFARQPEADVLAGGAFWCNDDSTEFSYWASPRRLKPEYYKTGISFLAQPSIFWRREVWSRMGYLNETLHYALDYDFISRCLLSGMSFHLIQQPLSVNRIHSAAKSCNAGMQRELHAVSKALFKNELKRHPRTYFDAFGLRLFLIFPPSFVARWMTARFMRSSTINLPGVPVPRKWRRRIPHPEDSRKAVPETEHTI
jgi:glycosyltransferase involved in cell wall biosynthesis